MSNSNRYIVSCPILFIGIAFLIHTHVHVYISEDKIDVSAYFIYDPNKLFHVSCITYLLPCRVIDILNLMILYNYTNCIYDLHLAPVPLLSQDVFL